MTTSRSGASKAALATLAGLLCAVVLDRWAPYPSADVERGSEEAFAQGLEWRELPLRKSPRRWTKPRAWITFSNLPPGQARLDVAIRFHRRPVQVTANGVIVALIPPGSAGGSYDLGTLATPRLEVELLSEGHVDADGRRVGTALNRVTLRHAPATRPRALMLLAFGGVALLGAVFALAARLPPCPAALVGAGLAGLLGVGLAPYGLLRSAHACQLPWLLLASVALACAFASASERGSPGSAPWAFGALLAAALVQGVAAVSPLLVTSDAAFHAHNLLDVSRGELYLTSLTPHARPFRIPYGVSFYALLSPLLRLGADPVTLVRGGAAVSGVAASAAVYLWLARGSRSLGGLAVMLLQLLPGSFVYYSEGTLSNIFGQSLTTLFFTWWAGAAPFGAALGGTLLALGGLAHLSSLIVLVVLCGFLVPLRRREAPLRRARTLALAFGFGLAALYYAHFLGLIVDQAPRLLEGAGRGGGAPLGLWSALLAQARGLVAGWGLPAMALALFGWSRLRATDLARDLAAFWWAGAVLLAVALLSPLETRYVYALTVPVAVTAARGALALWQAGGSRKGLAVVLVLAQAVVALRGVLEALLTRYRP